MKSIDMEIHIRSHPCLLYERLTAPTEDQLQQAIWRCARTWGKEGIWSNWADRSKRVYYPPQEITHINTYSKESF